MMIDNRIADEIDRLTADLSSSRCTAASSRDQAIALARHDRDAVTLRPMFETDPAMKELAGPAIWRG